MFKTLKQIFVLVFSFLFFSLNREPVFAQSSPYYNDQCPQCDQGPATCLRSSCTGSSTYCGSGTEYQCAYACFQCTNPDIVCTGSYSNCGPCDNAGYMACFCTTNSQAYQIIACGTAPTPGPSGSGTPTPSGGGGPTPTPTPTPTPRFYGTVYNDPNAVASGIGGSDNLCTGDTSNAVGVGGNVEC